MLGVNSIPEAQIFGNLLAAWCAGSGLAHGHLQAIELGWLSAHSTMAVCYVFWTLMVVSGQVAFQS